MGNFSNIIQRDRLSQQYTPDELLQEFDKYVRYMNSDGLIWTWERVSYKGDNELFPVPKRAPLTVKGFCLYAKLNHLTFVGYLNPMSTTYKDYNEVASYINDYCAVDTFNGASVGIFNGNLAAAVIKKDFGIEDLKDSEEANRVDVIRHEIEFVDYTDVTNGGSLPPAEALGLPRAGEYDNKENTSSRHDNMKEYEERNGINVQVDDE